jgi:NADP-dependent 3-hydroxy acid dehydrogenase YdfG
MLKGKVAVVTGSTSGIGLGIARAFAAGGADLVINGFGEVAAIENLRQEIATTYGVRAAFSAADLSKPADATGLIEDATRQLGRVDVLVNNAGIQHVAPVHEFPVERWDAVIAINLTAVFLTTRAALPQMLARDWGRIINIASVHGLVASEDKSAYVAPQRPAQRRNLLANMMSHLRALLFPQWLHEYLPQSFWDQRANQTRRSKWLASNQDPKAQEIGLLRGSGPRSLLAQTG